ncbi:hypothetical protein PR048_017643 [Dryococelus australis]|uniref:RNA-directed DNA polymerase n=1 Tax=Dryococelus australis TaxID=614101 RepID=A0ABQ9HAB5_9NEOP|nr:hypothetical protein PR048_017643 [Dryococelus australis]
MSVGIVLHTLKELHTTHEGICKMKSNARAHFSWPNLDKDIENFVKRCAVWMTTRAEPPKAEPRSTHGVKQVVHMREFIRTFREYFSRFGLPKYVVTDKAKTFCSHGFFTFLSQNAVRHETSPPFHPATNELAENDVKSFKKVIVRQIITKESIIKSYIVEIIETLIRNNKCVVEVLGQRTYLCKVLGENILRKIHLDTINVGSQKQ